MQPPYAPPPAWLPPRRPAVHPAVLGIVIAMVALAVFAVIAFSMFSGFGGIGFGGFPAFMFLPFCGIFFFILIMLIAVAAGVSRRPSLPPPPPIQQPMVPAGMQGPIALNCPDCGAPPESIDRFGVATCTHCGARFLVR